MNKSQHILKSTIIVATATSLAKLIGFARESVLAAFFGAGITSDAFLLAFTIPDVLLGFITASVASCYIPTYYRAENKTTFTRILMTWLLVLGVVFSVVFTFFPNTLVTLFASQAENETRGLAGYFLRYMVWAAPLVLMSEIFSAQLEIHGDFFSAGIRSLWRNVAVISGIILGVVSGFNILIAVAPVVGSALSLLSLAFACRKRDFVYRPVIDIRSKEIQQMLFMALPVFISHSVEFIGEIVNRTLASSLPAGAISTLNYSGKTQWVFGALIGLPLATVLFPYLSRLASNSEYENIRNSLVRGVTYLASLMTPICVGMIVLAQPIVRILFQRGAFTEVDVIETARCLRIFATIVVTGSINALLVRGFHAVGKPKTPAYIYATAVTVHISVGALLLGTLRIQALALGNTLASAFTTIMLILFLRRHLGTLGLRSNYREFLKIAVSSVLMGAVVCYAASKLPLMTAGTLQSILLCAVLAVSGAVTYNALLFSLRSKIAIEISSTIMKFIVREKQHP